MPESTTPKLEHYVAPVDETPVAAVDAPQLDERRSGLWIDAWRDIRKRPMFYISAALLLVVLAAAFFPQWFTSVDPTKCDLAQSLNGPSEGHPFGYNRQGCDIYSRVIHGTSTSLSVGLISTLLVFVLGTIMGAIAGFFGGWVDAVLSRIGDIFFSIPYILAAVIVMGMFKEFRNIWTISLAIGLFAWASSARVLRAEVLRVKPADYVTASKAQGLGPWKTLWRHVLPNSMAPMIVVSTLSLAASIVAEASLSFLGVGLGSDVMSWGNDISQAQADLRTAPMNLIYPSIALSITVLAFILLGELLRDALDPKARAQR
ncbi:peptide ABC transporter permease [Leucobacter sp. OLJS4]|uniref:ABC transporter permease n=1 Tax=unclassified Leucobacter TaxID=2621730 RepID=UPI000C180115|nr:MULTISPECIES: ABC transporter permease [unclassified Leucobacter]PIJ55845.1 peptide ABC transporter permease [Leucobacter sp. OLES1]PII84408.1 peptide ABC transporter permease [Leucobacter sp. OLCALW19]PII90996.1 peptide ABC transporter permease [Leucobacter sp. OLAS13]PII95623.1 peptide ABC transporter permease [Leucobacter sp. OLTLW20]PII97743.1 peptide ABC transporter permease [Leucobacter sp. OLDS2]